MLLIEAESDAEVERRTLALGDGHRVELWSRARFVAPSQADTKAMKANTDATSAVFQVAGAWAT